MIIALIDLFALVFPAYLDWRRHREPTPFFDRVLRQVAQAKSRQPLDVSEWIGVWLGSRQLVQATVIALAFALVLPMAAGHYAARKETTYLYSEESGEVLLRQYGDAWAIGRIELESGQLAGNYRLVQTENLSGMRLTRIRISVRSPKYPEITSSEVPSSGWL